MNAKDFYKQFSGLGKRISDLEEGKKSLQAMLNKANKNLENTRAVEGMLRYLSEGHKSDRDPGKHGSAYFFVKKITNDKPGDIEHSEEPSMHIRCGRCNEDHPVLMEYEQTFDSPDGDTWMKKAFTLCKDLTFTELAVFCRDYDFLER